MNSILAIDPGDEPGKSNAMNYEQQKKTGDGETA